MANRKHGATGITQQFPHIRKINIYKAWTYNQFGDGLDTLAQHVVCHTKGYIKGYMPWHNLNQSVIWYGYERVAVTLQLVDSLQGVLIPDWSFKGEWHCDNRDRDRLQLTCYFCYDWSGSRPGTPAHSAGDEEHIGSL
jgi:hypothetical protein